MWQASSIPTYNMDRGGMVSHGLVTQCDPHQNPKFEVKQRSLVKPRTPVFTNNCHRKTFFPRDLNVRNFFTQRPKFAIIWDLKVFIILDQRHIFSLEDPYFKQKDPYFTDLVIWRLNIFVWHVLKNLLLGNARGTCISLCAARFQTYIFQT